MIFLQTRTFTNGNMKPSTGHITLTTAPLILTNDLRSHLNPVKSTVPQDDAVQPIRTVRTTSDT